MELSIGFVAHTQGLAAQNNRPLYHYYRKKVNQNFRPDRRVQGGGLWGLAY